MQFPDQVGVMVLPNAILFPQALMPLYIFEPRYRQMLRRALEEQRMFAVALMEDSGKPRDVAGVGLIRACVDRPDGTSNLILQGLARVRFTGFEQDEPYPIGRIEVLPSADTDSALARTRAQRIIDRVKHLGGGSGQAESGAVVEFLTQLSDLDSLADIVTYSFIKDVPTRQDILETLDVDLRLAKVLEALDNAPPEPGDQPQLDLGDD